MALAVLLATLLLAGLLLAIVFAKHFPASATLRERASRSFKHAPLCALENWGITNTRRAHFDGNETVDILFCTPAQAAHYSGKPLAHSLVVVSDFGHVVERFDRDGKIMWRHPMYDPRGIALDPEHGITYIGDTQDLVALSLADGQELRRYPMGNFIAGITRSGNKLAVVHNISGPGALEMYNITASAIKLERRYEEVFQYPRAVAWFKDRMVVADTFGHRLAILDERSGKVLGRIASYFPNSAEVSENQVLVSEEHLDLVSTFNLDATGTIQIAAGCVRTPSLTADFMARHRPGGPQNPCPLSTSSPVSALFSPNDAVRADDFLYVADTDHHRVAVFKDGQLWGSFEGFNDPVNVRALP